MNIHVRMFILNDYEQNIIKLKRNNIYDVSIIILDYERLNKEFLIMDYKILVILDFMPRLGRH